METFENIFLDLSKLPGRCRIAESGLGWKGTNTATFTVESANLGGAQWSRAARGYELKILSRSSGVIQLDGFELDVSFPPSCLRVCPAASENTRADRHGRTSNASPNASNSSSGSIWKTRNMR